MFVIHRYDEHIDELTVIRHQHVGGASQNVNINRGRQAHSTVIIYKVIRRNQVEIHTA